MYKSIILTGGISIFSSRNIFGSATREGDHFEFEWTNPLPPNPDRNEWDESITKWKEDMLPLIHTTKKHPDRISAEYSMIHALQKKNKLGKNPEIVIFHSNTFGGI